MNKAKQIDMDKMNQRADFNSVVALTDDFTSNIRDLFAGELNKERDDGAKNSNNHLEQ